MKDLIDSINIEDWENFYNMGHMPWDRSLPQEELIKIIREYSILPCNVLDIGCGTGSSSIQLAKNGYNVTSIDVSSTAIDLAKNKIDSEKVNFKVGDILKQDWNDIFDFVIDIGCFHYNYNFNSKFVELVSKNLCDNGIWFSAIGSIERRSPYIFPPITPPAHSIQDIINLVNPFFEIISIKTFNDGGQGSSFWSCFMRKR